MPIGTKQHSLSIGRLIPAPITEVFDAWLDAASMSRWMRPRPEVITEVQAEPTAGGKLRIVMRAHHREQVHEGVYRLIDRPARLRFSWSSDPAGTDTTVDVSFLASSHGATMLLLRHEGLKSSVAEVNHREGWRRILDRLADMLKTGG